jgi:signal transduction histidine kinase
MRQEDGRLLVTVSDDGPGVSEAQRSYLTRRFYQADPSRSGGGAGLGLAIVSAIAQLHEIDLVIADAAPGLHVSIIFAPSAS